MNISIQVEDRTYFPADMVLLSSSNPEGVCYIETMNLDGETNLKIKKALQDTCAPLALSHAAQHESDLPSQQDNVLSRPNILSLWYEP